MNPCYRPQLSCHSAWSGHDLKIGSVLETLCLRGQSFLGNPQLENQDISLINPTVLEIKCFPPDEEAEATCWSLFFGGQETCNVHSFQPTDEHCLGNRGPSFGGRSKNSISEP